MKPILALVFALILCVGFSPITGQAQQESWIYFSIRLGGSDFYARKGYQIWRVRADGSDAERIFDLPVDTPDEYIDRVPFEELETVVKFLTLGNLMSAPINEAEARASTFSEARRERWFTDLRSMRVSPDGNRIALRLEHQVHIHPAVDFDYGFSEIIILSDLGMESVFRLGFHHTDERFIASVYPYEELTVWYRLYIHDFDWVDDGSAILLATNDASSRAVEPILPLSVVPLDSTHKPFQIGEASRWTTIPYSNSLATFLTNRYPEFSQQIQIIDIDFLHRTATSQTIEPDWYLNNIACARGTCFMFGIGGAESEIWSVSRILTLDEQPELIAPVIENTIGGVRQVETLVSPEQFFIIGGSNHLRQVTYEDSRLIVSEPIVEPKVTFIRARGELLLTQFEGEHIFRVLNTDGTTLRIIDPVEITGISEQEFQLLEVDW